jgi:tRNA(fMet)-specific endonuclease VapC
LKKYLIDTNICIFYIKGKFELDKKFDDSGWENYYISEITLAELKFGVENSEKRDKNQKALDAFLTGVTILPIFHSLDLYAKEKSRLRKSGITIDDFDLLIGVTSVTHDLIMVTNNTDHFKRIAGIKIEDWTK